MIKVAVLIPTINRSEYLIRQLRYYSYVNSHHPVYIGDASNDNHKEKIEAAIKKLKHKIKINYHHWPKLNVQQTIARLGKVAQESYCAFTGDDDFLVPNSLTKCAEFLNDNKKYRTAQGKGILFALKNGNVYGELNIYGPYWEHKQAEGKTGRERLKNFSKDYWVPQFSVHRTTEFCADSKYYNEMPDQGFGEVIHSFTFICKGKSKFINCLYLIRDGGNPFRGKSGLLATPRDHFDWVVGSEWNSSFKIYFDAITNALVETDKLKKEEASIIVKQYFWAWLAKLLSERYRLKYDNSSASSKGFKFLLREFIKKIPGTRQLYSILEKTKASGGGLTFQAISSPSSPYYEDFKAILETITGQPAS